MPPARALPLISGADASTGEACRAAFTGNGTTSAGGTIGGGTTGGGTTGGGITGGGTEIAPELASNPDASEEYRRIT